MAESVNRQILLKSRPEGAPNLDNFELTKRPIPGPGEGEVLMRILYLSLDPYMRGRMSAARSYAKPADLGQPMVGGTVGEIVESRNPTYSVGDIVLGYGGWQEYALSSGAGLRKLDPLAAPVSTGTRCPRYARDDCLCWSSGDRPAEAWRDGRRRSGVWRGRVGGRANRQNAGMLRSRDCRRHREVPLRHR